MKQYTIMRVFTNDAGWGKDIVHEGNPLPKVRELLGGRWTRSEGRLDQDMAAAFWNSSNGRRVFVMAMPGGLPLDAIYRIAEARP